MANPLITVDDIMALRPCERWPRATVERLAGLGVTAHAIATHPAVSIQDKRWVLTNLLARGPRPDRKALVRWACMCALDACEYARDEYTEGVSRACIETTLRWCNGDATIEEVRRDRYAAYDAAGAADAADAAYAASAERHLLWLAAIIDDSQTGSR